MCRVKQACNILRCNLLIDTQLLRPSVFQARYVNTRYYSSEGSIDDVPGPNKSHYRGRYVTTALVSGGLVASFLAYRKLLALSEDKDKTDSFPTSDPNIPKPNKSYSQNQDTSHNGNKVFRRREVAEHNSIEKGVWITYKGNVYDITNFVRHHPGGSHTIMLGAGGDVEPFWQTYTVHHASEVQRLLTSYKIGILAAEDQLEVQEQVKDDNNPYAGDPRRNPLLEVHTQQPFNAETPAKLLLPTYFTPTDIFFVRNHLPVPEVDLNDYKLSICFGSDGHPDDLQVLAEFTLDDLKREFKPYSVDCVIQCSGNRRSDLKRLKEIKGLDWKVGAIGNARWTGVRLIDLLDRLSIKGYGIKHLQMEGLDCDMTGQSYGASISADIAFDPNKNVILAYEMNGQPLTRDHGFPLRFVAPGVTGARNVKWLGKIILSDEESHSHWQRKDYKSFSPNVDMFNIDFNEAISIQETPVQSAICDPVDGETIVLKLKDNLKPDKLVIPVKGYAFSGGGKMIVRVDVSIDGGQNWVTARLEDIPYDKDGLPDYSGRNTTYSWTRWSINLLVPEELLKAGPSTCRTMEVLCRAFDSAYNSQPERPETVWNVRGVVNNSWHKVKLNLKIEE